MTTVKAHDDAHPRLPLDRKVSPRERAAVLLALGGTSTIAGRALGVDPSTVRRWRQREDFRGEVAQLRLRLIGSDPVGALPAASPNSRSGHGAAR
ncbi:helix-turn-helix domain-containing protein [Streptomyces sp. NPDC005811]|uniref:helix-turn-helix domain-containing protein n=1 Tax=Streptomyces sp. NPDC005811 TaxID=3154565 RepID=UPI0033CA039A